MKRALVLGIGGQDGSYLADILLDRGYEVHGFYRRSSVDNLQRVHHLLGDEPKIKLHRGDLCDASSVLRTLTDVEPDEIYNVADQDHVGWSGAVPRYNLDVTAGAVANLLETVRQICPQARVYQPASSTVFEGLKGSSIFSLSESSPVNPLSVYACAKACAYYLARYYRQVHGLWVCTAILFNHDSPRRGGDYLLQHICRQAVGLSTECSREIRVGDPEAVVDVGYAGDYMRDVCDLMQLEEPDDFIVASREHWTVEGIARKAIEIREKEDGLWYSTDVKIVRDYNYQRPSSSGRYHIGDMSKLVSEIGQPKRVGLAWLLKSIMESYRPSGWGGD